MWVRVAAGMALFLGSLGFGWWLNRRGQLTEARASRLVRFVVMVPSPIVLCLSFWHMDLSQFEPWLLPLIGTAISAAALVPAAVYARRARLSSPQAGSFLTCAFFSNLGYLGAFTAFALYGEQGYALCQLYLVFFTPCFYTLGFGIAAAYGRSKQPSALGSAYQGELRLYPFAGMAIGVLLSLMGVPRPAAFESVNHVLIPVDTALYLLAIGAQLRFESPRPWLGACLAMCGIKFLYMPLVALALLNAFGITGLARFIVLLEASTPVAVSPLVLPLLFGLDRRLSNALLLVTTAAAIPWFILVLPLLQRL